MSVSVSLLMSSWTISAAHCFHGPDWPLWRGLSFQMEHQHLFSVVILCSAALMQLCHAERAHSFIPCLLTSRGQGSRRQGWLPSSGTGLLQSHCPSLLLKSWDELRGSVLPGLLGSLLHAGPCLGCKGFGWKLVHLPGEFNFSLSNSMTSKDVPSEQCGGLWQWLYGRKSVLVLSLFGK